MMKRLFILTGLAIAALTAMAQDNPYIVKTKNVKKTMVSASTGRNNADEVEPKDFLGMHFRYYSMCDWNEGMRFMVVPEKYDILVNTFCDATSGEKVSNSNLIHYIMIYKGHEELMDGRVHINFHCESDGKDYYYEIPYGTYDDYCYGRQGVPTLAYLGDVDKARELLMDQLLLTRTQSFREDTEYDGDGYRELTMPKNRLVKVVAVGVGTRSFPVKIVVEDEDGRQFYQNVAMSKTNSGMRDNEFDLDNAKYLFGGSFEFTGADMAVSSNIYDYLNQTVYTKYVTEMSTRGSGKVRNVKVPRFTGFIIDEIKSVKNTDFYTLTLRETESRRFFIKEITFSDVVALSDGNKDDYFGYLFGLGEGETRSTTKETRAAIREGRVIPGMTEDEVELAVGEAAAKLKDSNGVVEWLYNRSNGVLLVVQFDEDGIVTKASGRAGKSGGPVVNPNSPRIAAMSNTSQALSGNGTMRQK
jgi:hypothetical protein